MDGFGPAESVEVLPDDFQAVGKSAIFLHSGWRSCGTWMWERLRENPRLRAFYEPLHEDLARLRQADIGLFRPDSWTSGHGVGAPYFAEYEPLIRSGGTGVRGHTDGFAFDRFFAPRGAEEPALRDYVAGLLATAAMEGRRPALKFCRSLGRVPWFEANFPDALHAVVLRDPIAQWSSARRQMEVNRNRYFVLAPFIILARNAGQPLLDAAIAALGVRRPPVISQDLGVTTIACWRHVGRIDWTQRFRGFLALWAASAITALSGEALVVDAEALGCSKRHLARVEQELSLVAGGPVDLTPSDEAGGAWIGTEAEHGEAQAACRAALDFVASHGSALQPARLAAIRRKLAPHAAQDSQPVPVIRVPGLLARLDAATYVALSMASYPLRRTHYHLRRTIARI